MNVEKTVEQKAQERKIAETILEQLGGNKFVVMTGAKQFIYGYVPGQITFKLPRANNGINYVKITLNGLDLYDVVYERVTLSRKTWDVKRIVKHESNGLYFDMLRGDFERVTGLRTSLEYVYA